MNVHILLGRVECLYFIRASRIFIFY